MAEGGESPVQVKTKPKHHDAAEQILLAKNVAPEPEEDQDKEKKPPSIERKDFNGEPTAVESIELNEPHFATVDPTKETVSELSSPHLKTGMDKLGEIADFNLTKENGELDAPKLENAAQRAKQIIRLWNSETFKADGVENELLQAARHDIVKPLTPTLGYLDLADDSENQETREQYTEEAARIWPRLGPIIDYWQSLLGIYRGEIEYVSLDKERQTIEERAGTTSEKGDAEDERFENIIIPTGVLPAIMSNLRFNTKEISEQRNRRFNLQWDIGIIEEKGNSLICMRVWDESGGFSDTMFNENNEMKIGRSEKEGEGRGFRTIKKFAERLYGKVQVGNWRKDGETKGAIVSIYIPLQQDTPESDTLET
jgi:K+-sensing histidine kinase KdpD